MDVLTQKYLDDLYSQDRETQYQAFLYVLKATDEPVTWAYEIWDQMVAVLKHKDNHLRAIAAQLLINLTKSDPQKRMLQDFEALLEVTRDERFVTARHTIQSIWKVGAAGNEQKQVYLDGLERRFFDCSLEKNCTLIRYDIIQGFRNLYDEIHDKQVKHKALELIETETDLKYRKKYTGLWRHL